ncbi:TonB-dependent receptor [Niveispirillum cyanobacteriorum]|uniref:TonB-dependent receptor n=1 Tax=Niveispirillum cyanobacteriorum TaxID=1612173 RepID=A0A2K9NH16_9PROT|nr:TonB-dependent receptor [Niveispirillum cyanobacteriorum]AUN32373.1 TonB-dependent receptor [Niveispirillum cyanobacteriorum]GGE78945.1 TonB-dependent receptor [Niveispirillum cyanobacteriorum]
MRAKLLASACAVALTTISTHALAQDTAPARKAATQEDALQEIIVTATRRAQNISEVPLSITAFSQEDLNIKGVVGYEGLARETPGVVLNRPSANFNNFTARGIATNGYGANLQSTVAVYIDELPISTIGNTTVLDPTLFDVERVEFLRGPQGTLFGSGSLSGAMRVLTKSPDLRKFDAAGQVDFGLTGSDSLRQRYNLMLNTPLVEDELALRVVGFYRHEEGYLDNVGTGIHNSNTLESWGGRAILQWKPSDRMSVRLLASREDSNPRDSSLTSPSLGREKRISDRPDLYSGVLTSYNATIDYQFDGAKLTSSTTYSTFDQKFWVDLAGTFNQAIAFGLDANGYQDTFVEEVRLASDPGGDWDWTIGGFFLDRRHDVDYFYRSSPAFLAVRRITGLPDEYYQRQYVHTISHELAGFGELTYHVNEKFWLTGGLRYGKLDAQGFTEGGYNSAYLTYALTGQSGPLAMVPIPAATGVKAKGSKPSYKVSASYRVNDPITTYASVSTGFRAPVVNAYAGRPSVVNANDLIIPYGASSDDLTNYELGLKGRWLNGKLTAHLAAYYIDWKNIQVQANRTSDSVQFATNIGAARSKGIEFEIAAVPATGLTIGLNGSVNDAKVTKLSAAEAAIYGAVKGARLSSPRFQGSVFAQYWFNLAPELDGFTTANWQHVGSFPSSFPNVPGAPNRVSPTYGKTDSYSNVNASFGVTKGNWTATAYVENLFDDHSITYIHPEAFLASRFGTMRPRTVGIRIGYEY